MSETDELTTTVSPYPAYSAGTGPCRKCGANELRHEPIITDRGEHWVRGIGNRRRQYVAAEPERREYKPVFIGGGERVYSNTNQPPQQPDHWDEIIHPAKPERIHHTCETCGFTLSTRCQDASDAR